MTSLRELAKLATPGSWYFESGGSPSDDMYASVFASDRCEIADCIVGPHNLAQAETNAAYIAAASPDVVLKLLAVVEAARELRSAQRQEVLAAAHYGLRSTQQRALREEVRRSIAALDTALAALGDLA